MYEEYYSFREKPFSIVPDPSFLYMSSKHQQALAYLEYGLTDRLGFILLTGEIGAGKTTIIKDLLTKINKNFETAVIFNTNVSPEQLLELILNEFEIQVPAASGKAAHLEMLNHFLIEKYALGHQTLLILDEAQNLSYEALEEVRMISNLHTGKDALIQIILSGQPELRKKLKSPSLAQLSQRISVNYHLASLSLDETKAYIEHRLRKAGANGCCQPFSDEAITKIYNHSGGIPRSINILCDAALVYGYADNLKVIGSHVVDHVVSDRQALGIASSADLDYENHGDHKKAINSGDLLDKIENLESKVNNILSVLNKHIREHHNSIEHDKNILFKNLDKLLKEERARSDNLLIKYNALKDSFGENK